MGEPAVNWFPEEVDVIRPPEEIPVSGWAAANRVLGAHSAIKGPYNPDLVPVLVPVMDACQSWDVDEIVFMKPAQIGGTDSFLNVVGYYSDQDPSPIMVILADENTAKYVSTKKIKPMFRDSLQLRRLYNPTKFGLFEVDLPNGGYICMAWASSEAMLATRAMRIVIFDEVDKPGYYISSREGDAISLGRERTNTYPQGFFKHLILSTPTDEDGNITRELGSCDIVYDFHVPCPHCGQWQPLRWSAEYLYGFEDGTYRAGDGSMHRFGGVTWEGGREATQKQILETAAYVCGECGALWTTQQKNNAVTKGRMIPRSEPTGYERKIGFHTNRIYSLFDGGRLEKLVADWVGIWRLEGEKRTRALQGFVNSTLAEPWRLVTVSSTEKQILKARCDLPMQMVPAAAVALTCGVDVQKAGFWFCVRAWARDYVSWLVHYGYLGTWDEVGELLFETAYPVQDSGRSVRIWRAGIDTGGGAQDTGMSMTEETYWWLRKNGMGRGAAVWGTKGSSRPLAGKVHVGKALDKTPSGKPIPGGLQLIILDTDKIKDMFFYRLQQAIEGGEQAAYLNADVDEKYARQILAEEKRRDPKKGVETWVQVRRDNHLLDAECLCHIVADPEWIGGGVNLLRPRSEKPSAPARAQSAGSSFVNRYGGGGRGGWIGR